MLFTSLAESVLNLQREEITCLVDENYDLRHSLADTNNFLHHFSSEFDALEKENRILREKRDQLARTLDRHKAKNSDFAQPESVREALVAVNQRFPQRFNVLASALKSADRSQFRNPSLVFNALTLLGVAVQYGGIAAVPELLQTSFGNQVKYKPKDSPATLSAFPKSRDFRNHQGSVRAFSHHLTLGHGHGKKASTLQVYFDFLHDRVVEVAHCGDHLPTVMVNV